MDTTLTQRRIAVAIVDDDISVGRSLRRLCRVCGLSPTVFTSGREFLVALEKDPSCADCLILDTHMPEMSGIELLRHLVAAGRQIPTVIFTADEAPDVPAPYIAAKVVAYLKKPASAESLLTAVSLAVAEKAL